MGASFWSRRPAPRTAWVTLGGAGLVAVLLVLGAERLTPAVIRAQLPLEGAGLDEFFLTQLAEDPLRVLLTSRRENSTWTRDRGAQAGDPYWIRRYGDPARPGLPERLLLTSRSRGAHLFVPLGALELEEALAERADAPAGADEPEVRSELAQVYWNRSFAGVFLHLRFPKRAVLADGPQAGEPLDHDLLVARGNQVRTTDFLLQPNGELYRSALADGLLPHGDFARNAACGDELVLLLQAEPLGAARTLYLPLSLFDELGLCWGDELATIVDDRWRIEALPAFALRPPGAPARARALWNGALHLAARFETQAERRALERALERFGGS